MTSSKKGGGRGENTSAKEGRGIPVPKTKMGNSLGKKGWAGGSKNLQMVTRGSAGFIVGGGGVGFLWKTLKSTLKKHGKYENNRLPPDGV